MELAIIIIALLVLGSLVPREHTLTEEIVTLKRGQRMDSPYTKEDVKVIYRILTSWRVVRVTPNRDALEQHFEVLKGTLRYDQIRKML